jgi:hypothetical protein
MMKKWEPASCFWRVFFFEGTLVCAEIGHTVNVQQSEPKPSFRILEGIDGETRLTRYMSLPTFLLLLAGKVFIPTLTKLREMDRLESNVPRNALRAYWKIVEQMLAPAEDWLIKLALDGRGHVATRGSKTHLLIAWMERRYGPEVTQNSPPQDSTKTPHNEQTMGTLIDVWLDELAQVELPLIGKNRS